MKIRLAHHYWKNRENSAWNPSRIPFPEIEQELKQSYVLLEDARPKWRKYGDITVFFDYRPEKDIFDRDIVPISFAFVPDCIKPGTCYEALASKLAKAPVSQLEMDIDFPKGSIAVSAKKTYWPYICVVCAMLACLVLWGLPGSEKAEKIADKAQNLEIKSAFARPKAVEASTPAPGSLEQKVRADEKVVQKTVSPAQSSADNAESGKPENDAARNDDKYGMSQEQASARAWICANPAAAFNGQNTDCAVLFIKAVCGGQIESGIDFEKWARSGANEKCRRNRQWNVSRNLENQLEKELNRIKSNGNKAKR